LAKKSIFDFTVFFLNVDIFAKSQIRMRGIMGIFGHYLDKKGGYGARIGMLSILFGSMVILTGL